MDTGPSGKVSLSPPSPGPGPGPPQWPPCPGPPHHLPFSKYAVVPGGRSLPSPPCALTHAFVVPRPKRPHPAALRPGGFKHASKPRSTVSGAAEVLPPGSVARAATSRPQLQVMALPGPPRGAHLRARGHLPRAQQRRTPRRLSSPQCHGPGGLRVHAQRLAAPRPRALDAARPRDARPGCKPEDTPRRGQSARGAPGGGGGTHGGGGRGRSGAGGAGRPQPRKPTYQSQSDSCSSGPFKSEGWTTESGMPSIIPT